MLKRLQILFFFALILRGGVVMAQDPIFTQFYASPLQINPAFAGNAFAPFVAMNYRVQYPSFNNGVAYNTFSASYDQWFKGLNSGFGISMLSDNAGQGILKKNFASVHYAYRVKLNRDISAKIGIETGVMQSSLDWSKLTFYDQLDPIEGKVRNTSEPLPFETSKTYFDISTGLLVYGSGFYAGISGKHLATPNEGFLNANQNLRVGLPIRWTLHGGYDITLRKGNRNRPESFISPNLLIVKQGDFAQIVGGAYMAVAQLYCGLWYRQAYTNAESVIVLLGVRQRNFKIGYSYDLSVGPLASRTGGTHEVGITINLDPDAGKRVDFMDCFKMFR